MAWFRKDFASQLGFGSILLGRLAFGSMWLWRHGFRHILLLGLGFGSVFPLHFGLDRIVHAFGSVGFLLQAVVAWWAAGCVRYLFDIFVRLALCVDFSDVEKSENALRVPRR